MAVFGAFLQKAFHSISNTVSRGGLINFFKSEWFPIVNALLVVSAIFMIYYIYHSTRKQSTSKDNKSSSNSEKQPVNDLVWVNQITRWIFLSSPNKVPVLIESWIQDLNIALANQQNRCGILIYGLREGTQPPLVKTIQNWKMHTDSIEAEVLLQANEFGFFVTIQENEKSKIVGSSNYSAVVAQFQCWFTVTLNRSNGSVIFQMSPSEKNPIFRFVMKPLTKQTLTTTQPEAIANSIQCAVLETSFSANLATWCPFRESERVPEPDDVEEQSCFGDSESDAEMLQEPRPRSNGRSMSEGLVIDVPSQLMKMKQEHASNSVPGSGSSTPIGAGNKLRDFENSSKALSGSLGSLSSIHRTPSGRGPAKPIRVREKRLNIRINKIDIPLTEDQNEDDVICQFCLNLPRQVKETTRRTSQDKPVTFDLGSRSCQIEVTVKMSDKTNASGTIYIDKMDLERPTQTDVVLNHDDKKLGVITLDFTVIENYNSSNSNSLKRNSISTMDESSVAQALFSTPSAKLKPTPSKDASELNSSQSETKITMVTSRTTKSSPNHSASHDDKSQATLNETESPKTGGISFSPKSVAETALQDLSTKEKGKAIKKTKIMITSVEHDNLHHMESHEADAGSFSSEEDQHTVVPNNGTEEIHFTTSDSSPEKKEPGPRRNSIHGATKSSSHMLNPDAASLQSDYLQSDAKVRRTRSLIFGKKKKKDIRQSLVVEPKHDTDDSASESLPGLHKKSNSMTKLFSRMSNKKRKEKEKSGLKMVLENGQQHAPGDSPTANKPKRTSSFKKLMGKKDKTKTS
uniref:Uncharacterized protein LOC100176306 n=1 Tax=Phallusia mammillata TaxID=59560 RepID=A0A6F9DH70_9ASCI|nr:uncharacterized protein LOC100176306 [Phallusia mammillata]